MGVPRMLSRMNWPRFTGEVRVGFEVTIKTAACVNTPPRGLSLGSVDLAHLIAGHALDSVELARASRSRTCNRCRSTRVRCDPHGRHGRRAISVSRLMARRRLAIQVDPRAGFPPA